MNISQSHKSSVSSVYNQTHFLSAWTDRSLLSTALIISDPCFTGGSCLIFSQRGTLMKSNTSMVRSCMFLSQGFSEAGPSVSFLCASFRPHRAASLTLCLLPPLVLGLLSIPLRLLLRSLHTGGSGGCAELTALSPVLLSNSWIRLVHAGDTAPNSCQHDGSFSLAFILMERGALSVWSVCWPCVRVGPC